MILTVVRMVDVLVKRVYAKMVGAETSVTRSFVMHVAMNTVSARTEHASVSRDGMESIARSRDVQQDVRHMDSVVSAAKVFGSVVAMTDGTVPIVL